VRLESELRRALASAELRLHYQPVVDRSGVLSGAEALVRWEHPRLGLLPPAEFLDVAASSDLIVHLGSWVLQETCAELARWARPGTGPVPVHVSCNVVARQLGDAFTGQIASLLDRFDLPPSALSIEITEDELVDATAIARGVLSDLQRDGVGVAVDDFGTGYAPLSHMRDLPATTVKIDRSFVAGLGHDPADTAIVRAVIDLAHALGKEVVAEGVETQQQWELLRQYGCDRAQGFLFSRPLPAEAFPGLRLAG
jgi:EAL domain-containing protein (putative c-di-GMP-specific phosphodiesterase class I)